MAEVRAPSTRCLYALKWSIFSTWSQGRDLVPVTSDVSVVLSFLQEGPVTKQGISRWLVDAITLAYSSLGLQCPIGVRAYSTRGIASSWAWSSGVSIAEICEVAGWASPSTFVRFYNLDIPALQARVLSA